MSTGKFVWHEHLSSDPERAQDFYGALLGWEVEVWKPGEMDYAMISVGGQSHGGFYEAPEGVPPHWLGHVHVASADDAAAKAKENGGDVIMGPMDVPEVGRFSVVRDPQGAVLSAFTPAGEAPSPEGVFVWDELVTSDVEAAKRFYGEVFGWTTEDMDMGGGHIYTLLKRDGGQADAGGAMPLGEIQAPPHWLAYIAPSDIDAAAAKAKELGATVYREPWDIEGVGRLAIIGDPTGAVFGLFNPAS